MIYDNQENPDWNKPMTYIFAQFKKHTIAVNNQLLNFKSLHYRIN